MVAATHQAPPAPLWCPRRPLAATAARPMCSQGCQGCEKRCGYKHGRGHQAQRARNRVAAAGVAAGVTPVCTGVRVPGAAEVVLGALFDRLAGVCLRDRDEAAPTQAPVSKVCSREIRSDRIRDLLHVSVLHAAGIHCGAVVWPALHEHARPRAHGARGGVRGLRGLANAALNGSLHDGGAVRGVHNHADLNEHPADHPGHDATEHGPSQHTHTLFDALGPAAGLLPGSLLSAADPQELLLRQLVGGLVRGCVVGLLGLHPGPDSGPNKGQLHVDQRGAPLHARIPRLLQGGAPAGLRLACIARSHSVSDNHRVEVHQDRLDVAAGL
mmetsp:Transcript_54296/g.154658  ORF Transcript_54296/g.154658 Transcript_54296/m.154658 type:complete len:327 (-) Transcript_54296:307-1287(-)